MKSVPETTVAIPNTEAMDTPHLGTLEPWGKLRVDIEVDVRYIGSGFVRVPRR